MPHVLDNVPTSLGATSPSVSSTRRVWRNHCRLALTVRTTDRPIVPRRPIRWTDGSALGRGGGPRLVARLGRCQRPASPPPLDRYNQAPRPACTPGSAKASAVTG